MKISLLANHSNGLRQIAENVPKAQFPVELNSFSGRHSEVLAELERVRPDLAVAELEMDTGGFDRLGETIRRLPRTSVVLLASDRSPEFLLNAMRIGVREVVPLPLMNGELKDALQRQFERLKLTTDVKGGGKVLGFISAKGGSGATFVATSLASALAVRGQQVGFFDLNLHFGDAIMYLTDRPVTTSIVELAKQVDRLDSDYLRAAMMPIGANLWASPGPETPERAIELKPSLVEKILSASQEAFSFCVIDMGRAIDAVAIKALDACDTIYVVMQYTIPSIHDTRRLLQLLAGLGIPKERITLVANRVQRGGDLGAEDVQKALNILVKHQLPNSWQTASHTANHGISIIEHAPKDPLTRSISDLAGELVPKAAAVPNKSILGSLFGARKS